MPANEVFIFFKIWLHFRIRLENLLLTFEYLKARGLDDCLQMTHFHMGSQVSNIRKVKDALTEAARVYVERALREVAGLPVDGTPVG